MTRDELKFINKTKDISENEYDKLLNEIPDYSSDDYKHDIFVELYNYGLKTGWSNYIRHPNPEIRSGILYVKIPGTDKEKAIEYLKSKFDSIDDIKEVVKNHTV